MNKRQFLALALTFCLTQVAVAPAADLGPLVRATQRIARDQDSVTVVWWMPPAFMAGLLEQTPASQYARQTLDALQGFNLFALLHVSRNGAGTLAPASLEEVLRNSHLEVEGKIVNPLAPGRVSPEAQQILEGIQRGLVRSMGLNGQALYMVAYPADENGFPLLNPKVSEFTFHSYGHDFVFSTSLPDTRSLGKT